MKKVSDFGLPLTKQELRTIVGGDDFSGCSVTCNPGYYACCNYSGPTCQCKQGQNYCDRGGPGAPSCEI